MDTGSVSSKLTSVRTIPTELARKREDESMGKTALHEKLKLRAETGGRGFGTRRGLLRLIGGFEAQVLLDDLRHIFFSHFHVP